MLQFANEAPLFACSVSDSLKILKLYYKFEISLEKYIEIHYNQTEWENILRKTEKQVKSMEKKQNSGVRTMVFDIPHEKEESMKEVLHRVYDAMSEKGYNPINQIVGYLLSEDPTYITNHKGARSLICKIDRDELLNELVKDYLGV